MEFMKFSHIDEDPYRGTVRMIVGVCVLISQVCFRITYPDQNEVVRYVKVTDEGVNVYKEEPASGVNVVASMVRFVFCAPLAHLTEPRHFF